MALVALRKESVDRNAHHGNPRRLVEESLSARRAWIEIKSRVNNPCRYRSLSARRAWIEIPSADS